MVLSVAVCIDPTSQITFFMASENRKLRYGSVGFAARGLLFFLRVSNRHAPWQQRTSMINNPNGWITAYDCVKHEMWRLGD